MQRKYIVVAVAIYPGELLFNLVFRANKASHKGH